jgi:hypothetical protein
VAAAAAAVVTWNGRRLRRFIFAVWKSPDAIAFGPGPNDNSL